MLLNLKSFALSCIFIPFPFYSEDAITFAFWLTEFPPSQSLGGNITGIIGKYLLFLKKAPYISPKGGMKSLHLIVLLAR